MKRQGHVQRAINAAFDAEPNRRFTIRELAALAYPNREVERQELKTVSLSVRSITPALNSCRVGAKGRMGWHNVWGRA